MVERREKKKSIRRIEKRFLKHLIIVAAMVLVINSPTLIGTTPAVNTITADMACNIIDSLSAEDFSRIDTIDLTHLIEYTDPDWISDTERLYYPIILKNSRQYNVDPLLVKAMIMAESGFNPNAVSQVGAQGLMQLMPITAKSLGVEDAFNPEQNIQGGVKYIKRLLDRFNGDVELALAAYNAGSRKVRKFKGVPPYPETKNYVRKVSNLLSNYKKSGTVSTKCENVYQI